MSDTYLEYATEAAAIADSEAALQADCAARSVAWPEQCDQYIPGNFYTTASEFNAAHPELAQRRLVSVINCGSKGLIIVTDRHRAADPTVAAREKIEAELNADSLAGLDMLKPVPVLVIFEDGEPVKDENGDFVIKDP